MERLIERVGGLDVHKQTVAVCVRVPGSKGTRAQHVRPFGTTAAELLALRDWLGAPRRHSRGHGEHRRLLETDLLCPGGTLRLPGGQRRPCQAGPGPEDRYQGLRVDRATAGARPAAGSFVPPAPIRELRDLTRYRKVLPGVVESPPTRQRGSAGSYRRSGFAVWSGPRSVPSATSRRPPATGGCPFRLALPGAHGGTAGGWRVGYTAPRPPRTYR
jgi:hypothetical protein